VETGRLAVAPSPSPASPSPTPYNGPDGEAVATRSPHQYAIAVASPDGRNVVYLRNDATTVKGLDTELVLANSDGSDPRDLTSTPENEYDPLYWTSDGFDVVFWRDTIPASDPGWNAGDAHLVRKNIASGAETLIAPGVLGAQKLAWMPTGDQFAAVDGVARKIVLVDALTGDARTLAVVADDPQLQVGNLRWDAGGRNLLVDASSHTTCESCDPLL
jgi:hypothetical protein